MSVDNVTIASQYLRTAAYMTAGIRDKGFHGHELSEGKNMSLDISPAQKSSVAFPLTIGMALIIAGVFFFTGPEVAVSNARYCAKTAKLTASTIVAHSGKTRKDTAVSPVKQPASMARGQRKNKTSGPSQLLVANSRCLPSST